MFKPKPRKPVVLAYAFKLFTCLERMAGSVFKQNQRLRGPATIAFNQILALKSTARSTRKQNRKLTDMVSAMSEHLHLLRVTARSAFAKIGYLRGIAVVVLLSLGFSFTFLMSFRSPTALADTNNTINFQARLEAANGSIVPDGNYDVEFKLYNAATEPGGHTPDQGACTYNGGSPDSTCLWTEDRTYNSGPGSSDVRVRVANGYLSVDLGSITAFPTNIDWNQNLYLSLNIGGTTGSGSITWDGEMSPRLHLTGVPYAFRAGQLAQYDSTHGFTSSLVFQNTTTGGNQIFQIPDEGTAGTYTLLTTGNGVELQSASPGTQQTGNFNISGTGLLSTLDATGSGTANTLTIGGANSSTVGGGINIGTSVTSGALTIGGTATTGTITLGQYSGASTDIINVGNGATTGTQTINIGANTGSGGTQNINIGNSSNGTNNVTVGSTNGSSTTTINGGTGGVNITTGNNGSGAAGNILLTTGNSSSGNASVIVKSGTNSTAAFQVQNATGTQSLLTVDTVNNNLTFNGGTGSLLGNNTASNWSTTTALGSARKDVRVVAANGYVYTIGGSSGSGASNGSTTVNYSKVNGNGTLGSWTSASALPQALASPVALIANNVIYVIGGTDTGVVQNTVYYAHINADGSLGSWQTSANTLPVALKFSGGAISNGFIYVVGGENSSNAAVNTVYYAPITSTGNIGTWTTNANNLASSTYNGTVLVANNYIYFMGGNTNSSSYQYAQLNSNGSTSAWTLVTASVPNLLKFNMGFAADGNAYVVGGYNGTNCLGSIEYAPLGTGGALGAWSTATSTLPAGICSTQAVVMNGYAYIIGGTGADAATSQTTAYYISLPRTTIAGSLDLIGSNGGNLADSGSQSGGNAAGSLTAGNTTIVGTLQVQDYATFARGVSVNGSLSAYSDSTFADTSNSTAAFQVQNASGNNLLNVDTTNSTINIGATGSLALATITNVGTSTGASQTIHIADTSGETSAVTVGSTSSTSSTTINGGTGSNALNLVTGTNGSINATANGTGNINLTTNSSSSGTTVKSATNSATAFVVQNASGTQDLLQVDTANNNIILGGNNSGALQAWTLSGSTLAATRIEAASVTANGYLYEIGGGANGSNASAVNTVYSAKINTDGSLGSFTSTTSLPANAYDTTAVAANGFVYVLGGNNGSSDDANVYYAKLNVDGTVGSWNTGTSLPTTRSGGTSVTANGYIYYLGGQGAAHVYYAKLNADGSIGSWTDEGTVLPAGKSNATSVVANGYVYVIGGSSSSSVYYATLNSNGTTGAFSTNATPLPQGLGYATSEVANGYVYVIGGTTNGANTGVLSTVYYGKLNSNGSVTSGTWSTSAAMTDPRWGGSGVIANGYVYVIAGNNASGNTSNIYYASTQRVQIGGSLDLVGLAGQNLAGGGLQSDGSSGGSITAGDITAVGTLQVQGQGNFSQGLAVSGNVNVGGSVAITAGSNNNAFDIRSSGAVLSNFTNSGGLNVNGANSTFGALLSPAQPTLTLVPSGSMSGNTYYYVVTATNAQGETLASPSNNVTPSSQNITVSWNQVAGATGYKIYRNTSNTFSSGSLLLTTITNGSTTSYTDANGSTGAGTPPTSVTGTGVTIQGWASQTANLLQLQNSGGTTLDAFNAAGTLTLIGGQTQDIKTSGATSLTLDTGGAAALALGNTNANAITLGNTTAATTNLIQGGTGASAIELRAGTGGTISIGTTNDNTVAIGTASASGTITVGGTATTGTITVGQYSGAGTNIINVGNGATTGTQTINIGANTGSGGTQNVNVGSSSNGTNNVTVGSTSGASATTIKGGTGNVSITTGNNGSGTAGSINLTTGTSSSGNASVTVKSGTNSTTAFQVQNASGYNVLDVDTTNVTTTLGNITSVSGQGVAGTLVLADGTNDNFGLTINTAPLSNSYSLSLPATGGTGVQCLASTSGSTTTAVTLQFTNCGAGVTLQTAYNNAVGGTTPEIKVDSTRGGVDIQDADTSINGSLFTVRGSNASGLGTPILDVNSNGTTTSQNLNVGNSSNVSGAGRLFSDGFESGNFNLWQNGITTSGSSSVSVDSSNPHSGKYDASFNENNGSGYVSTPIKSTSPTIDFRGYVYITSQTTGNADMIWVSNGSYAFIMFRDGTTGNLDFWDGANSSIDNGSTHLNTGQWYEIEADLTMNASTGTVDTYVNGVHDIHLTGQNTGATPVNLLNIGDSSSSRVSQFSVDDVSVDTVRPGDSSNLNVNDSLHVAGTSSFGGNVMVQTTSNSTNAFQVQNASGTDTIDVDTADNRVGIGGPVGAQTLDVYGTTTVGHSFNTNAFMVDDGSNVNVLNVDTQDQINYLGYNTDIGGSSILQTDGKLNVTGTTSDAASTVLKLMNSSGQVSENIDGDGTVDLGGNGTISNLGDTNVESTLSGAFTGIITAQKVTTTTGGTIKSITSWISNPSGAGNNSFQYAIYSDSSGAPGSYIASSAVGTLGTTNGWYTLPVTATLSPVTSYWIVYWTNDTLTGNQQVYTTSGGTWDYHTLAGTAGDKWQCTSSCTNGLPNTFPAASGSATLTMTMYATFADSTPALLLKGSNGAATFENTSNSSSAFQIQNASGSNIVNVDTTNGKVTLTNQNASANNAILTLANSDNTAGIEFRTGGSGSQNLFIGDNAGQNNALNIGLSQGEANTGVGYNALSDNTSGHANGAFGWQALQDNTTGTRDNAFGADALQNNVSGLDNSAFGDSALQQNQGGNYNTAVGSSALAANDHSGTNPNGNTAVGYASLYNNDTGTSNTAIGLGSGFENTTGSNNTYVGFRAGKFDDNNFLSGAALQNASAIGSNAEVQANNSLILGGEGSDAVNVGIGTTIPLNTFSVSPVYYSTGTAYVTGSTVTGVGTTFTSAMIGMEFIFANGEEGLITAVGGATSLTINSAPGDITSGNAMDFRIHVIGFQVTSSGTAYVQSTSTTAFQVQNASGTNLLSVDTSGNNVNIGAVGSTALSTTLNLATSTGASQTVHIADTSGETSTVTVGSASGSSATTIQAGQGNLQLITGAASGNTGSILIQSGNSSSGTSGNVSIDTGASAVNSGSSLEDDTFESGTDGWTSATGESSLVQSGAQHHLGSNSLAATSAGTGNWGVVSPWPGVSATPGQLYNFTAWVRSTSADTVSLYALWTGTGSNTKLGTVTDSTTGWTEITGSAVAPASTTNIELELAGLDGSSITLYADDVTISSGTSTPAVIIGSSNAASVLIGNENEVGSTVLQGGSGSAAVNVLAAAGGTVNIANGSVANTLDLGSVSNDVADTVNVNTNSGGITSTTTNIGSSANANNAVNIEAGNTGAINVGAGNSNHTINVGTGSGTENVNIGGTGTSSTTKLQAGALTATMTNTGGLAIQGSDTLAADTALKVSNSAGTTSEQIFNDGQIYLGVGGTSQTYGYTAQPSGGLFTGYYQSGSLPNPVEMLSSQEITTTTGGLVTSISTYIGGAIESGADKQGQMAIYTDNGSNKPNLYVASTAVTNLTANSWNTWPISATLSPSTNYWLVYWTNDDVNNNNNAQSYNNPTGGAHWYQANNTWGCSSSCTNGMPNTMPTGSLYSGSFQVGIYVNVSGGGPALAIDPNGNLSTTGTATFENAGNTASAFQVQNASGVNLFNVDTSGNNINIGNSTIATTVNLGAVSNDEASTVNINTKTGGSATKTTNIGSTDGASATTISAGSGNILLKTNNSSGGTIVQSVTSNSSTAFQIQNANGVSLLNEDTANSNLNVLGKSAAVTNVNDWHNNGVSLATLNVSPATTGNLMALAVEITSTSYNVTSVSGGGVTNWHLVKANNGSAHEEIWEGTVTSTGASTITVAYSGTPGVNVDLDAEEFTAGLGAGTNWFVTASGAVNNGTSTTLTYPSLTATQTNGLYWGYGRSAATGSGGSTSGFNYTVTGSTNVVAYNPSMAAGITYSPTANNSGTVLSDGIAMIISPSVGGANIDNTLQVGGASTFDNNVTVNAGNSATAFQVQNASGVNLFKVDTSGNNVNIGNGAIATTVNLGAVSNDVADTVNINTDTGGSATKTTNIGSTDGASATNIYGGTGNINLQTNSGSAGTIVKSNTNSATAFQIQNSGGTSLLTADTTKNLLTTTDLNIGNPASVNSTTGRVFADGFESPTATSPAAFPEWTIGKTTGGSSTVTADTGTVYAGKYSLKINAAAGAAYIDTGISTSATSFSLRGYVNLTSQSSALQLLRTYNSSTGGIADLGLDSTGHLSIVYGAGTVVTGSQVMSTGVWHQVELRYTVASGTATLTAYLDGVQSATTAVGTVSTPDRLRVGDPSADTGIFYADDVTLDTGTSGAGNDGSLYVTDSAHFAGTTSVAGSLLVQPVADSSVALNVATASGLALLNVNSASQTVNLGNTNNSSAVASTVNLATSTANAIQTINIGSNGNAGNAVNIQSGTTGGINIGNNNAAQNINIGAGTTGGTNASNVTIGSTNSANSTTIIQGGQNTTTAIQLLPNTAGGIMIGAGAGTGTITLGQSTASNEIDLGIANSANVQTIKIGTGASSGSDLVTVGSNGGASAVTIQGGSGNISLKTNNSSGGTIVQSVTSNSTKAFVVQDASGNSVFNVDTSGDTISLGKAGASGITGILSFLNSGNSNAFTIQAAASGAAETWTLPSAAPTGAQCLGSTGAGATVTLQWSTCNSSGSSLQAAYNTSAGASPSILETATNGAVTVQSAFSSGITGSNELFGVHAAKSGDTLGNSIFSVTADNNVTLGSNGNIAGALVLQSATSNSGITLKNTSTSGTAYTLTLPTAGASATNLCLESGTAGSTTNLVFNACANANTSITHVTGNDWTNNGTNVTTVSTVSPSNIGDLLVLSEQSTNATAVATVSGGGVTTWSNAVINTGAGGTTHRSEIWFGTVTSTGSSPVTVCYGTSPSCAGTPGVNEINVSEFTAVGVGASTTYGVNVSGTNNGTSSGGVVTYPSLTAQTSGELYYGYAQASSTGSNGSTSGFSYYQTPTQNNEITYDPSLTGATTYQPTSSQSTGTGTYSTTAAIFEAFITNTAINNSTSLQKANFYVQAAVPNSVAGTLQANGSGDILDLLNTGGKLIANFTNNAQLVLGNQAGSINGSLVFQDGSDSNSVTINAPGTVGSAYSLTLPAVVPGPGLCLGTSASNAAQLVFSTCTQVAGAVVSYVNTWSSSNSGSATTSLSVSPASVGDLMLVAMTSKALASPAVCGMDGGGVTTWTKVTSLHNGLTGSNQRTIDLWRGVVTSAGSSTINVGYGTGTYNSGTHTCSSSSGPGNGNEVSAQEYTIGNAAASWNIDVSGTSNNTSSSTTVTMPTLTPQESNEMYVGYAFGVGSPVTSGGTAGFTYNQTSSPDQEMWVHNGSINGGTPTTPSVNQNSSAASLTEAIFLVGFGSNTALLNSTNQQSGNFYIQSNSSGNVSGILKANGADALDIQNSSGNTVDSFDQNGNLTIQSSGGVALFSTSISSEKITIGPAAGDTTGAILVLGNKTNAGDPTGVAGAMYYNSSTGSFRCYDVDHWENCLQDARTTYHYIDDFTTPDQDGTIRIQTTGTGASCGDSAAGATASASHPGVIECTDGTTNSAAPYTVIGVDDQNNDAYILGSGDYYRFESDLRIPTLSGTGNTFTVRSGFGDQNNTDPTNGCILEYSDTVNGGKWEGLCSSGGVSSTCDTGITVASNTWYRLTVAANAAGTSVNFQVNGSTTNGTGQCQVTSHIPTKTGFTLSLAKSAGATARTLDIDYIEVYAEFGTSR